VRLAPQSQPFRHPPGSNVLRLAGGDDTVRLERRERVRQKRLCRLAGIAPALVRAAERPADLVGLGRVPWVKRHVSDHLPACFLEHGDSLAVFAGMVARKGACGLFVENALGEEGCDLRIRHVGEDRRPIAFTNGAQGKARRCDFGKVHVMGSITYHLKASKRWWGGLRSPAARLVGEGACRQFSGTHLRTPRLTCSGPTQKCGRSGGILIRSWSRHEQRGSGLSSVNLVLYSQKSRDGYDTVIVGWPVGLISEFLLPMTKRGVIVRVACRNGQPWRTALPVSAIRLVALGTLRTGGDFASKRAGRRIRLALNC